MKEKYAGDGGIWFHRQADPLVPEKACGFKSFAVWSTTVLSRNYFPTVSFMGL